jgi:hypothetical protein
MIYVMSGPGNLVVKTDSVASARAALSELIQAWARDIATGSPIHILELGAERRGGNSGCECPSCGLPLTAVNAARIEFVKRPHFRHPEGAARDECMLLAARAAAMRQLQEEGWIDLPRRRMSARATGLSGDAHEAWVELPPERVRITEVDFRDRVVAVLSLDDGRQLRVELTGTLDAGEAAPVFDALGHPVPTILLAVNDLGLAGMAPDDLRRRLKLLPSELCWQAHWDDLDLVAKAAAAARDKALSYFDALPEGLDLPEELDPALKRQTVLHHEVMKLLAESQLLYVPGWVAEAEAKLPDGRVISRRAQSEPEVLSLGMVELEERFGHIVPDVTCKAWPVEGGTVLWPLFIEVTVTNPVTAERFDRIRNAGQPTLEVDLRLAGGRVDRQGLRQLVVEELATKRWLFHPEQVRRVAALAGELVDELASTQAANERLAKLRAMPLGDLRHQYLDAVRLLANAEAAQGPDCNQPSKAAADARAALAEVVEAFASKGYPEAGDANLIGARGMIPRILSIQLDCPVGYRVENVAGVLNAIEQSQGIRRSETSIYLIAVRAYPPSLTDKGWAWFEEWAARVRASLKLGETTYLRDPSYDRLLSILFPKMADGLTKPVAKRLLETLPGHGDWKAAKRVGLPTRQRAAFLDMSPRVGDVSKQRYVDTHPGDEWLRGRDLEAWKKTHPESAKLWFGNLDGKAKPPGESQA